MTDNEIIKALERTASWVCDECKFHGEMCDGNKCEKVIADNALNLINRQNAEIERLEEESSDKERAYTDEYCLRKEWQNKCRQLLIEKQTAKSEAIKEFAKRLKCGVPQETGVIRCADVDNLVKEMTEVEK